MARSVVIYLLAFLVLIVADEVAMKFLWLCGMRLLYESPRRSLHHLGRVITFPLTRIFSVFAVVITLSHLHIQATLAMVCLPFTVACITGCREISRVRQDLVKMVGGPEAFAEVRAKAVADGNPEVVAALDNIGVSQPYCLWNTYAERIGDIAGFMIGMALFMRGLPLI